jgi:TDG/mug DNA glycosylase family protein
VLFVGINPGIRSAETGHHFAGPSNRFWKLLWESRLVPRPLTCLDDDRLPDWGYGVTNLVARPTPGVGDLALSELTAGRAALARKVRRWKPAIVALVGVMIHRAVFPASTGRLRPGLMPHRFAGAAVFLLPNPSGRNAHFSYAEMLGAFRELRALVRAAERGASGSESPSDPDTA